MVLLSHPTEKIDGQFIRIEDNKLSKSEYEHAHEALSLRVQAIENKMESETKAADAEHLRIETAGATRCIGNGKYIIILAAIEYFIWNLSDWNDYMNSYTSAD